jgi:HSP20 family molecular chaperone IbpA
MKNIEDVKTKSQLLSGFGNEDIIEEFYLKKNQKLRPGTIFSENDDEYKIEIGVPFIREEDLKVELLADSLIVRAQRQMPNDSNKNIRTYKGTFHISNDVKKDKIDVSFREGLLTVKFPKTKIRENQQEIDIKEGN